MLLATLALLAAAILGVAYRRGERRARWAGVAAFGWGFAALTLAPWSRPEALPTTPLLDRLYRAVSPAEVVALEIHGPPPGGRIGDALIVSTDVPPGAVPSTAGPADTALLVGTPDVEAFRAIGCRGTISP